VGSTINAKAEIAFEAEIGLDEGLRKLIDWRDTQKAASQIVGA
jgi:nucleoside-diphosphate-sugar epimerase